MFTNSQIGNMKFKRPLPKKPLGPKRPYRHQPVCYQKPWSRTARKSFKARPEVVELIDGLDETELLHSDQYHQGEDQDQMAWQQNSSQFYGDYEREYYNRANQHPSHPNSHRSYSHHHDDYNKENAHRKSTRSDHRNGASELDYYTSRSGSNRYAASPSDRRSPRNYDRDAHHHARSPKQRYNSRSPPRRRIDYSPHSYEREHFSRSPREQRGSRRGNRDNYGKANSSLRSPRRSYSRTPPYENKRKLGHSSRSRSRSSSLDRNKSRKIEHNFSDISPDTMAERKRRRKRSSSNSTDESDKKVKYFNEHKDKQRQKYKKMYDEYKYSPISSGSSSELSWNVNQLNFKNGKNPYKWVRPESNITVGLTPDSSEDLLDNSQRSEEVESDCNGDSSNNNQLLERNKKIVEGDDASSVLSVGAKSYSNMSEMDKEELEMRRHVIIEELGKEQKKDEKVDSVASSSLIGSSLEVNTLSINNVKKPVLNTEADYSGESNKIKNDNNSEVVKNKEDNEEIISDKIGDAFHDKSKKPTFATTMNEEQICNNVSNNLQAKPPHKQLIDTLEQSKEKAPGMINYINTLLTSGILNNEKKNKHVIRNENTSCTGSVNTTKTNQSNKLKDQQSKRNRNSSGNESKSKIMYGDSSNSLIASTSDTTIHTEPKLMIDRQIIYEKSNSREDGKVYSGKHCESHTVNGSEHKSSDATINRPKNHASAAEMENQDLRRKTTFSNKKSGKQDKTMPSKTTDRPASTPESLPKKRLRRESEIKQSKDESAPSKYEKMKQNDNVENTKSDHGVYNNSLTEMEKPHKKDVKSTQMNENIRNSKKLSVNKTEDADKGEHCMPNENTTPKRVRQKDMSVLTWSPSVVEGKMCRPSFGEYIPLGKSSEKKQPAVSADKCEAANKDNLFGKNQRRISHFAQKQSDKKKCSSPMKKRKELKSGRIVKHPFKHTTVRSKQSTMKRIGRDSVSNNTTEILKEKNGLEKNDLNVSNKQVGKEERLPQETVKPSGEKIWSDVMNEKLEEHRESKIISTPTNQYKDDKNQSEKVGQERKKVKGNMESDKGENEKNKKYGRAISAVSKPSKEEPRKEKMRKENVSAIFNESSETNNKHVNRTIEQSHERKKKENDMNETEGKRDMNETEGKRDMNETEGKRDRHCSGNIFEKMVEEKNDRDLKKDEVAKETHTVTENESVKKDHSCKKDVRKLKPTKQSGAINVSNAMEDLTDVKSEVKNKTKVAENEGNINSAKVLLSPSDSTISCKNGMLSLKSRTIGEKSKTKVLYYDESKNVKNMLQGVPDVVYKLGEVSGTNDNANVKESEIGNNDMINEKNTEMDTKKISGDSVEMTCPKVSDMSSVPELMVASLADSNRKESESAEINVMKAIHAQLPACVPTNKKKLFKTNEKHTTSRQMSTDKTINSAGLPMNQNGKSTINELVQIMECEDTIKADFLHTEESNSGKVTSLLPEQSEMDIVPIDNTCSSDLKQVVTSNELPVKAINELTNELTSENTSGSPNKDCAPTSLDSEENIGPSEGEPEGTSGELNLESIEDSHTNTYNFDDEDIEPIEMIGSVFTNERDLDAEEHEQNDFIERKSENENLLSENLKNDDVDSKVKFCDDLLVVKEAEKKDIKSNDHKNSEETLVEVSDNIELRTVNKTPRKKFSATLSGLGKILRQQSKSKALPICKGKRSKKEVVPSKVADTSCKNEETDKESDDEELLSIGIELTPSKQSSDCKEWLQKAKSKAIKIPSNLKSKAEVKGNQQKESPSCATTDTNPDVLLRNDESHNRSPVEEPGLSTVHAEMDVTENTPVTGEHTEGNGTILNTEKDILIGDQSVDSKNASTDPYTESTNHSQAASNHDNNESKVISNLSNDLHKKSDFSTLTNKIEVVHTKFLTNGYIVNTKAYLYPKRFYEARSEGKNRSKCLRCQSCTMLFSPLNFTLHHDTHNIVELIDPDKSKRSEYRLADRPSKDVANFFKLFIQYFHSEREKGCNLTRLPPAKSSKSVEKSVVTSESSPKISNAEKGNKKSTVGCPDCEGVQPSESSQSTSYGAILFNSLTLPLISGNAPPDPQFSSATNYSQEIINSQNQNGNKNTNCKPYCVISQGSSPVRNVPPAATHPPLLNNQNGDLYETSNTSNAAKAPRQRSEPKSLQRRTAGELYINGNVQHTRNESSTIQNRTSQQPCNAGNLPLDFHRGHQNQMRAPPKGYVAEHTPAVIDTRHIPISAPMGAVSQVIGTVPHGHQVVNTYTTNHDRSIPHSSQSGLISLLHQTGNLQSTGTRLHSLKSGQFTPENQTSNPSIIPPSNGTVNSPVATNLSQVSNQIRSSATSAPTDKITFPDKGTSAEASNTTSAPVYNGQSIGQGTHGVPETSASCESRKQQVVESQASISTGQKVGFSHRGLLAEVNIEERKRELLEELCMLENIKTRDRGLDILLLCDKLKIRGLSTVDKKILKLSEQKMKHSSESAQQQRPQTEEERIQNIADLKKKVSKAP